MNMKQKITNMVELQIELQCNIDPEWYLKNLPWWRACYVECMEAIEHMDWKWWKTQKTNIPQIKLEVVDIFHFLITQTLEDIGEKISIEEASNYIYQKFCHADKQTKKDTIEYFEELSLTCLQNKTIFFNRFIPCMYSIGLTFNELYLLYMGKNALNVFRQSKGYKEGGYTKNWGGKEDNEVLTHLLYLGDIYIDSENLFNEILEKLDTHYKNFLFGELYDNHLV